MTRDLVQNPPWATKAIAKSWDNIARHVPGKWLPHFDHMKMAKPKGRRRGGEIQAELKEYGCGVYGCVWPTNDPGVVLKLTTDDTEAEFATHLAGTLVAPICVKYFTVLRLGDAAEHGTRARHADREMHLLWRESAEAVGQIQGIIGSRGVNAVNAQKECAHLAFTLMMDIERKGETPELVSKLTERIHEWKKAVRLMMGQSYFLEEWGAGLLKVWDEQRILFGDPHSGNIGMVKRTDQPSADPDDPDDPWHLVITDPGHVSVVNLRLGSGV